MTATNLFDGISARVIETPNININVLERTADATASGAGEPSGVVVMLIHGNVSSSLFFQEFMLKLPAEWRVIAPDLRGFGDTETLPVDATRGLKDFADDIFALTQALGIERPHLMGWSMGGGIVMEYALAHPVASLTLQAPVSPYGFGGTAADGTRLTDDDAGTGAGAANPEFLARLGEGDTSEESQASPLSVYRATYVHAGFESPHEATWVASMLSTKLGDGNYPGTSKTSENWPGFAPGESGVLNSMAPGYFNTAAIVDLAEKPPVLWVHGDADAIVNDATIFDVNQLGALGIIPGWPGADVAPSQPMKAQTRAVLEQYRANGGQFEELLLENCGHSPHLEYPDTVAQALARTVGRA